MDQISYLVSQVRAFKGWVALSDAEVIEQALREALNGSSVYQGEAFSPDRDVWQDGFIYSL